MVEMRKGGLRGRELRLSGLKGSGGSVSKASKRLKGSVVAFLEGNEDDEGLEEGNAGGIAGKEELGLVGLSEQGDKTMEEAGVEASGGGGEESADKVSVALPQGVYLEGGRMLAVEDIPDVSVKKIECDGAPLLVTNEYALILAGDRGELMGEISGVNRDEGMLVDGDRLGVRAGEAEESPLIIAEIDNALDLLEAQPLQNMEFLKAVEMSGVQGTLLEPGSGSKGFTWADFGESNQPNMGLLEDFPPLSKESYKTGRNKGV